MVFGMTPWYVPTSAHLESELNLCTGNLHQDCEVEGR
jgi:hypothetical protein